MKGLNPRCVTVPYQQAADILKYMENDKQILVNYVQCFEWYDDELFDQGKVLVEPYPTDRARLEDVYSKIKSPLPQLYEELLLSYR